ncbi:pyridoxal-phosphate dependent enzyme, partial [Lysobacter sp. 2RAB21]
MDGDVARMAQVSAADLLAAQARLRRYLDPTPLHHAERFGCWLKLENLQRTGSYKVRGALNALLAARERGDHRTVIAASAGNHAQGLAWAAYRLGVNAITVMPRTAPQTKIAGVAHWGATVRLHGDTYDEAKAFAIELAQQHDYRLLSAFDDPDVIAGQGTATLELLASAPQLDTVIAPVSGGGLLSGTAIAAHGHDPSIAVYGAEPEGARDAHDSLREGRRITGRKTDTVCDGLRAELGTLTFPILRSHLRDIC